MKILYITPKGTKNYFNNEGEIQEYELGVTSKIINESINKNFPDSEIEMVYDLHRDSTGIELDILDSFDIYLCDLTTMNANVVYIAGQVQHLQKPVIYINSSDAEIPVSFLSRRILRYSESSLPKEFITEFVKEISSAIEDPSSFSNIEKKKYEPKAFISYSHQNKSYFDRLMVHLKPLIKKGLVDVWADTKIKTGDQWEKKITSALSESNIAILLVSADFMASDFIVDNELPPLLAEAEVKGTKILPVIISPCRFSREPSLSKFQAANSPNDPLSSMTFDERESVYDQLASDIEQSINNA